MPIRPGGQRPALPHIPASRVSSNPLAPLARFGTKDFCDAQCDFLHKAHFHCVVEECGALFSTLDGAIKHAK